MSLFSRINIRSNAILLVNRRIIGTETANPTGIKSNTDTERFLTGPDGNINLTSAKTDSDMYKIIASMFNNRVPIATGFGEHSHLVSDILHLKKFKSGRISASNANDNTINISELSNRP
tara:strand:+ start:124 stop:480 length:357 start_codon:yes stop_codon:yes gene_type:complete